LARAVNFLSGKGDFPMTPLSKTFLAFMAIAVIVTGTLVLLPGSQPAGAPARLTPAQLAEMQPSPPQPKATVKPADPSDLPPPPADDLEDGNGS
jgi:hypothetical protein